MAKLLLFMKVFAPLLTRPALPFTQGHYNSLKAALLTDWDTNAYALALLKQICEQVPALKKFYDQDPIVGKQSGWFK